MIDAAIVISLKRNELGRYRIFQSRWRFSIPLIKFEGIDGLITPKPQTCELPLGTYGCLLSHLAVIKLAKEKGFKSVLILEDDIRFIEGFEDALKELMDMLPENWDTLWLGGYEQERGENYNEKLRYNIGSWGGYGYILRDTVYDFYIQKLEQLDKSCDGHYVETQKLFNSFRSYRPYILHNHISSVRCNADNGIAI